VCTFKFGVAYELLYDKTGDAVEKQLVAAGWADDKTAGISKLQVGQCLLSIIKFDDGPQLASSPALTAFGSIDPLRYSLWILGTPKSCWKRRHGENRWLS
jgi:hypothetical protein